MQASLKSHNRMDNVRALASVVVCLWIDHGHPQGKCFAGETRCLLRGKLFGIGGTLAVAVALLCCGCETPKSATLPQQVIGQTQTILAAGDVIRLSFAGAPELSQPQKIRADGKISLPL